MLYTKDRERMLRDGGEGDLLPISVVDLQSSGQDFASR